MNMGSNRNINDDDDQQKKNEENTASETPQSDQQGEKKTKDNKNKSNRDSDNDTDNASVNESNPLNIPEKPLDLRRPKDGYLLHPSANHRQLKPPYGPSNFECGAAANADNVHLPLPPGHKPRSVLTYANCATKSDQIYHAKRVWHVMFSRHIAPARVEFVWCNEHDIRVAEAQELCKTIAILSFQALEIMRGNLTPSLVREKTNAAVYGRIIHQKNICESRPQLLLFNFPHLPACITGEHSFAINAHTIESTVRLRIGKTPFLCNIRLNKFGCRWIATELDIG